MLVYSKQIFGMVKCLSQNRKNSVCFRSFFLADSFGNFFLKHTREFRYLVTVLQCSKDDLSRNIIREVSDDSELLIFKNLVDVIFQKVFRNNFSVQLWIMSI